jgi:acetyl-CoA acetyltransferase
VARHADAAVCIVVGTDETAADHSRHPVPVLGTGWGSADSIVHRRDLAGSAGTAVAAGDALGAAGIEDPAAECDVMYLSDLYAHRQLMHMDALGVGEDSLPLVNPDGGALGGGDLFEATGGARLVDAVRQIRGEAGAHQLPEVETALVHGWRGLPTDSCAVAVLGSERR